MKTSNIEINWFELAEAENLATKNSVILSQQAQKSRLHMEEDEADQIYKRTIKQKISCSERIVNVREGLMRKLYGKRVAMSLLPTRVKPSQCDLL